ncbi:MAG: hypothetical protein ACJZ34_01455 [Candidatus Pelagibacter sp.]|tara:strand:+ start:1579 stop:2349 length:771 start_codon:yes stop_codon:yes gene_type:complete
MKFFSKKKKYSYDELVTLKKKEVGNKVHKIFRGKVASGLYKDMKISTKENWGNDLGSKILGIYEEQIQQSIYKIATKKKITTLINFGAAEGYHLIGPVKKKIIPFGLGIEIDKDTRKTLKKNIISNGLTKRVKIITFEDFKSLKIKTKNKNFSKVLILIDIEGNEYDLLNRANIKYFKNYFLIIELHEFMCNSSTKHKKFIQLLKKYYKIEEIKNSSRNPYLKKIERLSDEERWTIVSEGRPCEMSWLICSPKIIR